MSEMPSEEEELPSFSLKFDFLEETGDTDKPAELEMEAQPPKKKRFVETMEADRNKLLTESQSKNTSHSTKWASCYSTLLSCTYKFPRASTTQHSARARFLFL